METMEDFKVVLIFTWVVGLIAVIYFAKAARIRRGEFAIHFAICVAGGFGSIIVMDFVLRPLGAFLLIADLLFLYFSMARRMSDIGHSRWWVVLTTTIFGLVILPMLFFSGSKDVDENVASQPE